MLHHLVQMSGNSRRKETRECAILAQKFDAISVREDSGVILCKNYLGVNAVQLLDPTMLLDKEDYLKIVCQEQEKKHKGKDNGIYS